MRTVQQEFCRQAWTHESHGQSRAEWRAALPMHPLPTKLRQEIPTRPACSASSHYWRWKEICLWGMRQNVRPDSTIFHSFHWICVHLHSFANNSILQTHIRGVHENTSVYICEICAKSFKSKSLFERHGLLHSNVEQPRIQCHICNQWYVQCGVYAVNMT